MWKVNTCLGIFSTIKGWIACIHFTWIILPIHCLLISSRFHDDWIIGVKIWIFEAMLFETSHWSFPGLILLLSSKGQGQPAWCLFIWWSLIVVVTWVGRMYLPTWTDRGSTKPEFILSSPLASWIWYIYTHRNDVFVDGFEAFNAYGTFMPFLQKDVTPLNRSIVGRVGTCQNCVLPLEWKNQILAFLTTLAWWRNTWTLTSSSWSLQPWSLDVL